MTTPVNFTGESDGLATVSSAAMFLPGMGPNQGNWRVNANPNAAGKVLQHFASSTWSTVAFMSLPQLSGLKDALLRGDWGTSACGYPPSLQVLQDTADGTDLLQLQGGSYTTVIAALEGDRQSLIELLCSMGLP